MGEFFGYLYPTVMVTGNLAYFPQIKQLLKHNGGAQGMSLPAWLLWFFNSCLTFCYAAFTLADTRFAVVSAMALFFNGLVCCLVIYHRYLQPQRFVEHTD